MWINRILLSRNNTLKSKTFKDVEKGLYYHSLYYLSAGLLTWVLNKFKSALKIDVWKLWAAFQRIYWIIISTDNNISTGVAVLFAGTTKNHIWIRHYIGWHFLLKILEILYKKLLTSSSLAAWDMWFLTLYSFRAKILHYMFCIICWNSSSFSTSSEEKLNFQVKVWT